MLQLQWERKRKKKLNNFNYNLVRIKRRKLITQKQVKRNVWQQSKRNSLIIYNQQYTLLYFIYFVILVGAHWLPLAVLCVGNGKGPST